MPTALCNQPVLVHELGLHPLQYLPPQEEEATVALVVPQCLGEPGQYYSEADCLRLGLVQPVVPSPDAGRLYCCQAVLPVL